MNGTSRRAAAVATLLVCLAAPTAATAAAAPDVTRPVRINRGDDTPTRTYSSPSIAVDPEDENNVLAAYAEMRTGTCGVARSVDGGRTWKRLKASPSIPSYPLCFAPSATNVHQAHLAFGRNHTAYLALSGWDVQDGRATSVFVARSTDLGDSWSTTLVRDARGKPEAELEVNRPLASLVVDRSGPTDIVYVGWARFMPNARPAQPGVPVVAVSSDGGRTFAPPVDLRAGVFADERARQAVLQDRATVAPPGAPPPTPIEQITADRFGGCCARLTLGPPGTVYAMWSASAQGVLPPALGNYFLSRSTDGGKTFTASPALLPSITVGNPVLRWSPTGGPEGTLHVVYEEKVPPAQGDRDIYHRRSTDGGRTWSEARLVNDDDGKLLRAQFMPALSVAPDGRLDAAWWDFRNDTGAFLNDLYLSSSFDNGTTWSRNVRVTDRSIDRRIGPWSNGYDVRQPAGLAPTARYTVVAWDDTRNGDPDGQAQDLYGAFVQFRPLPATTTPALSYAFAAVVGLALAGLIVSVIGLVNRRRAKTPPVPHAEASTEPAGVG